MFFLKMFSLLDTRRGTDVFINTLNQLSQFSNFTFRLYAKSLTLRMDVVYNPTLREWIELYPAIGSFQKFRKIVLLSNTFVRQYNAKEKCLVLSQKNEEYLLDILSKLKVGLTDAETQSPISQISDQKKKAERYYEYNEFTNIIACASQLLIGKINGSVYLNLWKKNIQFAREFRAGLRRNE